MPAGAPIPLIEPIAISDVYVSGIAQIEALGPNARITFYVDSTVPEAPNMPFRNVALKVVVPTETLPLCIRQAVAFIAERVVALVVKDDAPPTKVLN